MEKVLRLVHRLVPLAWSSFFELCPSSNYFNEARRFGNRLCFCLQARQSIIWCNPWTELISVTAHHNSVNLLRYAPENRSRNRLPKCSVSLNFRLRTKPKERRLGQGVIRGGADKSLARHTSRCHRTESTVSLERRVCSCAELKVYTCYRGWKETCQATHENSTTSRCELSSRIFLRPARQGAEGNSHHSDRNIRGTCTIVCHRQKLGGPV